MLYINEQIRRENPLFSGPWWKGVLTSPHVYLADGIQDFSNGKDQVIPTPSYKEPFIDEPFSGHVYVLLLNCHFERLVPLAESDQIRDRSKAELERKMEELENSYTHFQQFVPGTNIEKMKRAKELFSAHSRRIRDCKLYDRNGSLEVSSGLNLAKGAHLMGVHMLYLPAIDLLSAIQIYTPEVPEEPRQRTSIEELLFDFLPQFS